MHLIRRDMKRKIDFAEKIVYEEPKKYLVETGRKGRSLFDELLSAFKCPTHPEMYIHIVNGGEKTGVMEISVIFKDSISRMSLNDITGFRIRLFKNIREGNQCNLTSICNLVPTVCMAPNQ